MMFERLRERGNRIASARVSTVVDRIASRIVLPRGVMIERSAKGITLIGKRLKLRIINDTRLRAMLRLAQGVIQ